MRVPKDIPNELKRLINAILKRDGDCEGWLNGYNRNPWGFTWYGSSIFVSLCFVVMAALAMASIIRGTQFMWIMSCHE